MRRVSLPPRADFAEAHAKMCFHHHAAACEDGLPYWAEGAAYEFTLREIETIEAATQELHNICLETVSTIIESGEYPNEFALTDLSKSLINQSWERADTYIYGRFDLMFDPMSGAVKMYEYNADTPTSLLEAAVAQWQWLEDLRLPDQFNSIHEKLVARWREALGPNSGLLHLFASEKGEVEDWANVEYMADAAVQAGWDVRIEAIESIGFDAEAGEFVDPDGASIAHAFKLYAWEWMTADEFGARVAQCPTRWFEPPWKMLLSNKAILPVLWERFPGHPNLIPAYFEEADGFVRKPTLGREGANVHRGGRLVEGSHFMPEYDAGYIYQEYEPLPEIDGRYPVIGSWMIGDEPAGIGIREDRSLISGNGSHFVPHYFVD